MKIDKSTLEKAAQLPEEQLASLVYAVVNAAGGSRMQAKAAACNTGKLKKKLSTLTDNDIEEALRTIDQEKLEAIMKIVKESGGLNGG